MKFFFSCKKTIAESQDEFGRIAVEAKGNLRYLVFGEDSEQSCVRMDNPALLEYQYSSAMLLGALCHPDPETALFLGLGGGALTQACMATLPDLYDIEIIELRPEVVRMARDYMGFDTEDERLTIRYGDAAQLLESAEQADLIFMDMYSESGPAASHLAWTFLQNCRAKLNDNGWLIINQWATLDNQPLAAPLLRGVFEHQYWELPVKEGNVILFVPQNPEQSLPLADIRNRANQLAKTQGYRLLHLLEKIRRP